MEDGVLYTLIVWTITECRVVIIKESSQHNTSWGSMGMRVCGKLLWSESLFNKRMKKARDLTVNGAYKGVIKISILFD